MPYQGSSQSIGFRNRTVIDPSKRMRQEAAQIEERGQERIRGMERQASQEIQEMKRVSDLEASNQRYELQALSKFSSTINKFLQEDVVEMVKEEIANQIKQKFPSITPNDYGLKQETTMEGLIKKYSTILPQSITKNDKATKQLTATLFKCILSDIP